MSPTNTAIRHYIEQIRESLDALEAALDVEEPDAATDPYARRQQLLQNIYVHEGLEKPALTRELRDAGTTYQWIGQQVKKGYLSVIPSPTGKVKYTVTPKAVRELELNRLAVAEEAAAYTAMSAEAFAEDWDSPEDAVYDHL